MPAVAALKNMRRLKFPRIKSETPADPQAAERAERLRLIERAAQIGTWEWDPVSNTSLLSAELHHIFGTEESDPHHASLWASRVHPDDIQRVRAAMEQAATSGTMEFEYRYLHPQRGIRWLFCRGRRFRDNVRLAGVVVDLTGSKQVQEAQHRLAAIVESSDDAIVSKTLEGIITSWNAAAERMFGYTAEEIIGRSINLLVPPELHEDERRILETIACGGRIAHFETVRVTKSGERLDVSLTVSPIKD